MVPAPSNMVQEGVPPVPTTLADLLDKFTFFRAASLHSWHPVRLEMLMGTTFGQTTQIHRLEKPLGTRTQLTFARERSGGASFQPTKGEFFLFNRDEGGNENYQKFVFWPDAHKEERLTDGKSRNLNTVWSTKGDAIAFSSNARNSDEMDLCLMTVEPARADEQLASAVLGKPKILLELHGEGWAPVDWSPDDKQILMHEEISANENDLWLVDVATAEKKRFVPENTGGPKVSYGGGRFSPDGKRIYLTCDRDGEFSRLCWVDVLTKEHHYLTPDRWDVDEYSLSWDGKKIAYTYNEDGFSTLHVMNIETGKEVPMVTLDKGLVSDLNWHKNNHVLGFALQHHASPSDIYSFDFQANRQDKWTESETGYFNAAKDAVPPQIVRWKSFDGKEISGLMYKPPARFTGKRPVMIHIHGGTEGQSRPHYLNKTNYYLNELGIALIYPNVRGSTGYGKTMLASDNGMNREATFKDIGALLDWIKTQKDLDADRIMVTGGSYGGFMTLAISTLYSDRIRCALDTVGISNLITFLENTSGYRRDLRRVEYGDERIPEMREFMKRIAPANNAAKIKKPLFVVQGANDPRVPASEALQMVAEVRRQGTPVWFLMAKDEGHGFNKKANVDYQFYATVLFIKKFLLE
jgi:dipeptidyl aminopeptidase/acylaminoacyl peptidase